MKNAEFKKRLLAVLCFFMVGISATWAQQTIKGTVIGTDDEPIIGANILEKGSTNGTVTDFDGNFTLSVKKGATLVISYIGYLTQEVQATPNMNIVLKEDSKTLDELIVVGYGVQKKSSITGSISKVDEKEMQNRTITSAVEALGGKTSGVQILSAGANPGANPVIRVRGYSSNYSSEPLYIVDGLKMSSIGNIDANDIESMEVLKDAASAAIYGAEAGNGVVLITTKKGKGNGKFTYDFQYTSQSLGRLPQVMNAQQFHDYFLESNKIQEEKFQMYWDGKSSTDWTDVAFEKSAMARHNVTWSAGSDKGSFYFSVAHLNNNGMVVGDKDVYERLTGMINASYKIKPWMEIVTNNQIEHRKERSVSEGSEYGSMLLSVLQLDPLTKPYYDRNNLPVHMQGFVNEGKTLLGDANRAYGISPFSGNSEQINPLVMRDRDDAKSRGFSINGSTSLNLTPIKGLTITSRLGYRLWQSESYSHNNLYYYHSAAKNDYISVNASEMSSSYYQWENFLNYMKTIGDHTASIMVGTSFSQNRSYSVNASAQGKQNDDGSFNLGFEQNDPNFFYFSNADKDAIKGIGGGKENYSRKLAYFGRLSYDYQGKYMAQFNLRADAADLSILPMKKRWGYFPGASLGWVISSENFMENTRDWLSHLKLRASWGQNGSISGLGGYMWNVSIAGTGSYPVAGTPAPGQPYNPNRDYTYINGYAPSSTGNNDLKWETSEQTNLGIDARFLNNRLTFSFDYFNKLTKDLIITGTKASTVVGNTFSPVNAGNITNKGIEIELGWQDRIGDFSYSVRGNVATLKNEVTKMHESLAAIQQGSVVNVPMTRFEVGQPAWYFYGYKYIGANPETGDAVFEDVDGDGAITPNDKTYIGKGIADFTYGITLTASYKGFDAIIFGTGSQGADILYGAQRVDCNLNTLTAFTEDRWTPNHKTGTMPRSGASNYADFMASSGSVFDGSYFKIKQIQLGYTLPKSLLKKVAVESLRIYGSLEDFFTFTNYPGFDPEVTGVGSSLGIDKGAYPNSKKVVLGLSLSF